MTVFVVHPVREDISPALKFGPFRFITERYVYGDELDAASPDGRPAPLSEYRWILPHVVSTKLVVAAHEFDPRSDFLLIAGDHLQFAQFVSYLGMLHENFTVLRYDRKIDDYLPVRLDGTGTNLLQYRPNIGDQHGQDRREGTDDTYRSPAKELLAQVKKFRDDGSGT